MRTILNTVGTSLLTNAERELKRKDLRDEDLAGHLRRADPAGAAAETHALLRLEERGLVARGDRMGFIHSDTDQGRRCALALQRHFARKGHETWAVPVPHLQYAEGQFKLAGLRSFVTVLLEEVTRERKQGAEVIINATGGFKPETAYATLVGVLVAVPVYYVHEAFREIVALPPIPLTWDFTLLGEHEDFFEWISADLRPTPDVDRRLGELAGRQRVLMLLSEEDGYTCLSPTGEAFYGAYRAHLEAVAAVPVLLSQRARATYAAADETIRALWDKTLNKLRSPQLRRTADAVANSDCRVFPRGHRPERVFFYEEEEPERVCVCELARHGDGSYERLLKRGVWRRDYRGFERW